MKRKKVVYVAHPIGGDIAANVAKLTKICRRIHICSKGRTIPFAPYLLALQYLNDAAPGERILGTKANLQFFGRGFIKEVWLFGKRISPGMWREVRTARKCGIPVLPKTSGTQMDLWLEGIAIGERVVLAVCGPGQIVDDAIFLRPLFREGERVGIRIKRRGRVHGLWWGDVCQIYPFRGPQNEQQRRSAAMIASCGLLKS